MDDVDHFLAHYGVKGMRWGQRKKRSQRDRDNFRRKAKLGAAATGALLVGAGVGAVSVAAVRATARSSAEQAFIRSVMNTAFVARDKNGNVISRIGSEVTSETINALRSR